MRQIRPFSDSPSIRRLTGTRSGPKRATPWPLVGATTRFVASETTITVRMAFGAGRAPACGWICRCPCDISSPVTSQTRICCLTGDIGSRTAIPRGIEDRLQLLLARVRDRTGLGESVEFAASLTGSYGVDLCIGKPTTQRRHQPFVVGRLVVALGGDADEDLSSGCFRLRRAPRTGQPRTGTSIRSSCRGRHKAGWRG